MYFLQMYFINNNYFMIIQIIIMDNLNPLLYYIIKHNLNEFLLLIYF